jgi:hypothetical protein
MPYIGENRAAERRLLAAIVYEAVPKARRQEVEGDLAQADILAAAGQSTRGHERSDQGVQFLHQNNRFKVTFLRPPT